VEAREIEVQGRLEQILESSQCFVEESQAFLNVDHQLENMVILFSSQREKLKEDVPKFQKMDNDIRTRMIGELNVVGENKSSSKTKSQSNQSGSGEQ
jgi:histone acetyltransferase (RNA polymerase elongator complex component)